MNKYKLFVLTNILFHICLVFLSALWMIANYIGFIPVLIYSAIVSNMAKVEYTYSRLLFNSMLVFFTLAALLTLINDILLTGMLFSLPGIMVAITTQPMLVRYCRETAES
jgi:hypothetical protein